jgi:hypothetical protein
MPTADSVKGLSRLQREILCGTLALYRDVEEYGNDFAQMLVKTGGVGLKHLRPRGVSPADRAAFSRALKRLEARGLIVCSNTTSGIPSGPRARYIRTSADEPHGRTDSLFLTDLGRETTERLTNTGVYMLTVAKVGATS